MGRHVCEYCGEHTCSGELVIHFGSGRSWEFPDMILHYIADHGYLPPPEFIHDVLKENTRGVGRALRLPSPVRVGYLTGEYPQGPCPEGFFMKLWSIMTQAVCHGGRRPIFRVYRGRTRTRDEDWTG